MTKIGVEVSASCTSKEVGYGRLDTMGILWRIDDLAPRNGSAVRACPRQRSVVAPGGGGTGDRSRRYASGGDRQGTGARGQQGEPPGQRDRYHPDAQRRRAGGHDHGRQELPPAGIPLWGVRADHHTPGDRPGGASYRSTQRRRLGGDDSEAGG